jgi:HEAT repeat protein
MSRKRRGRGPISAEELIAQLEADPEYVAETARQDQELARKEEEWRRAEAPLVEELRGAGFEVESAWDLVNTSTPYPEALPILLQHLERAYPDRVREGIARALAVRPAKFGWTNLVQLYRDEPPDTDAKDGLAVALAAVSDDEVIDDVIALARDGAQGGSRLLLLRGLKRSQAPQARAALEEFADDSALGEQARRLLDGSR